MDVLTKEQRSKNMSAIRHKNTKAEVLLAKTLWSKGFRYRKNDKTIFGKPDLAFKALKIAIFVDGEFFHGRDWDVRKHWIKTNTEFWWNKIESNMKRDQQVNAKLVSAGWQVIRFWDKEVLKNLVYCLNKIEKSYKNSQECL